jgi:anaerobic nitric oxide reductase transcription regulator
VSSISLSDEALSKLQAYDWPGNVRELEHAINRGAVIAKAQSTSSHVSILAQHITLDVQSEQHQRETEPQFTSSGHTTRTLSTSASLKDAVDEFQTQYVRKAFLDNNQNLSATAKQLSVNPGNLHRLMKRLNLK